MSARIHVSPNILNLRHNEEVIEAAAGQTLHEWMLANVPGYSQDRETQPVECLVNGQRVAPEDWPCLILAQGQDYDLAVRPFGFDPFTIILAVSLAVSAVALASIEPPPTQQALPDASPTYDATAQGNNARLMEPIPFACGRNRHNMDWLSEPWRENTGNTQNLYQLFCVGYGEFDLETLMIGDTPADEFPGVQVEVCGPDDPVTLFPDNVDTSDEVAGIELFGPNEDEYTGPTGYIVLVTEGQKANFIGLDFACRAGLYGLDDDGDMYSRSVTLDVMYQQIDDEGNAIGTAQTKTYSYTASTNTPQRWSERIELTTTGRYQVALVRTNSAGTDSRVVDSIHWEGARAYYPSVESYPGVTKIAVIAQGSNSLSAVSERKFNLFATAKMPVWQGDSWSDIRPSREIAWNFCNAIRSEHGGRLDESLIDLDNILGNHQIWASREETTNRVFDTRGTLLSALQEIAACGRGNVLTHNGKFYVVIDMQRMIRNSMYTPFDMLSAPTVERSFPKSGDNDSIIVEFWNASLSAMDEVLCQLPNHTANNPKRIKLPAVDNLEQAFNIGIYEAAKMVYRRMQIKFSVSNKGLNSIWGDRAGISYWLKGWGSSGEVISHEGARVRLTDPVILHDTKQNYIALCRPDGSFAGPYPVEAGANAQELILQEQPDFQLYTGDRQQRTQYQVGVDGAFCRDFIITKVSPAGDDQVDITALWDNPVVYTFDDVPVPEKDGGGSTLPNPSLPSITSFLIVQSVEDPQTAILSWQSSGVAQLYLIDHSLDGGNWARVQEQQHNTWETRLYNGINYFRVAAVGDGQGEWAYETIELKGPDFDIPPSTTVTLREPFTGPVLKVKWDEVLSAVHYQVEVVKDEVVLHTEKNIPVIEWDYSAEQARNHGAGREFAVRVTPFNAKGRPGEPASLDVRNEPPAAPNNIIVSGLIDGITISCDPNTAEDIRSLRVWGAQSSDFTPSPDNLLADSTTSFINLTLSGQWYFRLGWVDQWGDDTVLSSVHQASTLQVDETVIGDDSISTPKLKANAVTADKCSIQSLSAVSAYMGTVTGGTFKTDAAAGVRVEISSAGNYPFWIGTGDKTYNNAQLVYDKIQNKLTFKGQLSIKSAETGGRLEINNNIIKVFDASNVLRVEIGQLF